MLPWLAATLIYQSELKLESKCGARGPTCTLNIPILSPDGPKSPPLFRTTHLPGSWRTLVIAVHLRCTPNDVSQEEAEFLREQPQLFTRLKKIALGCGWKGVVRCFRMITGCKVLKWQGGRASEHVQRDSLKSQRLWATSCLTADTLTRRLCLQTATTAALNTFRRGFLFTIQWKCSQLLFIRMNYHIKQMGTFAPGVSFKM